MDKRLRKPFIAGNWKMNKTPSETTKLIEEIKPLISAANCTVAICVPFVDIQNAVEATKNTHIGVGAQNCYFEEKGAYTGEVSAEMLKDSGVRYVILGHSERRTYFGETDEIINKKIKAALKAGLNVIFCVGESLEQREQNITFETIAREVKVALKGIDKSDLEKVTIAYEPIWAVGTGKNATPAEAEEICAFIRMLVSQLYDKTTSEKLIIQYGGSMNAKNAKELLSQPNIDGGLIGGAALKAIDFAEIVKSAC